MFNSFLYYTVLQIAEFEWLKEYGADGLTLVFAWIAYKAARFFYEKEQEQVKLRFQEKDHQIERAITERDQARKESLEAYAKLNSLLTRIVNE